jgi:hypothetical protein
MPTLLERTSFVPEYLTSLAIDVLNRRVIQCLDKIP